MKRKVCILKDSWSNWVFRKQWLEAETKKIQIRNKALGLLLIWSTWARTPSLSYKACIVSCFSAIHELCNHLSLQTVAEPSISFSHSLHHCNLDAEVPAITFYRVLYLLFQDPTAKAWQILLLAEALTMANLLGFSIWPTAYPHLCV